MRKWLVTAFITGCLFSFSASGQIKPVADSVIGTFIIDLRPTPESEPYLKDFKFTRVEGKKFDGV